MCCFFFFSSRRRHTRSTRDWSSDVCSSDLGLGVLWQSHRLSIRVCREICSQVKYYRRSEERRVGKECRSRWWPAHEKKKQEIKRECQEPCYTKATQTSRRRRRSRQ